jgi:hypothetical protein
LIDAVASGPGGNVCVTCVHCTNTGLEVASAWMDVYKVTWGCRRSGTNRVEIESHEVKVPRKATKHKGLFFLFLIYFARNVVIPIVIPYYSK